MTVICDDYSKRTQFLWRRGKRRAQGAQVLPGPPAREHRDEPAHHHDHKRTQGDVPDNGRPSSAHLAKRRAGEAVPDLWRQKGVHLLPSHVHCDIGVHRAAVRRHLGVRLLQAVSGVVVRLSYAPEGQGLRLIDGNRPFLGGNSKIWTTRNPRRPDDAAAMDHNAKARITARKRCQ